METSSDIFSQLRDLFAKDDGSLPEIRIDFSSEAGVLAATSVLSSLSGQSKVAGLKLWSVDGSTELNASTLGDGASMVTSAKAEPFHVLMTNIRIGESVLPDLGVFVFQRQLAIDYRMGQDWTPAKVNSLFGLLTEMARHDPECSVHLEDGVQHSVEKRFAEVWSRWKAANAV